MKRHPALEPFSRDHNVGLVLARSLMEAKDPAIQAKFASIWVEELEDHFNEEERLLGSLAIPEHKSRLCAEHQAIREAASGCGAGSLSLEECHALGELLDRHIRWEERELFLSIEGAASEATLASLAVATQNLEKHRAASTSAPRRGELAGKRPAFVSPAIDLSFLIDTADHSGPIWGTESEQLDTTLLFWRRGEGVAWHVNGEVDVLMILFKGSAEVSSCDKTFILSAGQAALFPRNTERSVLALEDCSYLNVHQRRKRLSPTTPLFTFQDRQLPDA
jgi:mannose-6-phosphate isomerase-like protein (cupin superfamily)